MLASLCFTLGYTIAGHHDPHENIAPLSGLQWLLWITCWLLSGLYAVVSWRRGGQTLGMRPWRLVVVGADGSAPSWRALCVRYAGGTAPLLGAGRGVWGAWDDGACLAVPARASGPRMLRLARAPRG